MTIDQKERIVRILEAEKKRHPGLEEELDALIFAVRAVSPFQPPAERIE